MEKGKGEKLRGQDGTEPKSNGAENDDLVRSYVALLEENARLKTQDIEERRQMRLTLQQVFEYFKASSKVVAEAVRISEEEAIDRLVKWVSDNPRQAIPSLIDFADMLGVIRRQLDKDRWPNFHLTYTRLKDVQRASAKQRAQDIYKLTKDPDEEE